MASDREVVVEGGGANLYKISEYDGWYYAYHVRVGFLSNTKNSVGKARSLRDALDLIRMHSGREIKSVG